MEDAGVAAYIARWRPSPVPPLAAAFARSVITEAGPAGRERAKNLLRAAGKLAGYGIGLGLEPVPEVLLHPSVAERFTRGTSLCGLRAGVTRLPACCVREPGMYPGSRVAACRATMPSATLTDRRRRSGTGYQAVVMSRAVERARRAAARAIPSDMPV
jgi:hypothetical protein